MRPDEAIASRLRDMNPEQVIETLRYSLEAEYQQLHQRPRHNTNSIALLRHVLTQVGGPQDAYQMNLLSSDYYDANIPAVFCNLMGATELTSSQTRIPTSIWIEQLSSSRIFRNLQVNFPMVVDFTQKLKLPLSILAVVSVDPRRYQLC